MRKKDYLRDAKKAFIKTMIHQNGVDTLIINIEGLKNNSEPECNTAYKRMIKYINKDNTLSRLKDLENLCENDKIFFLTVFFNLDTLISALYVNLQAISTTFDVDYEDLVEVIKEFYLRLR